MLFKACHNPPGGGIPLASVQGCVKQAAAGELLVSAPVVTNEDVGQELAVQMKHLVTSEVPEVVQGICQTPALVPVYYFLGSPCCPLTKWCPVSQGELRFSLAVPSAGLTRSPLTRMMDFIPILPN